MKINNAIATFFETKEQYTNFISAWKKFIADGNHKKYPVFGYDGTEYDKVSDLACVHHLLYAALRGRDITKNFTPNNRHTDDAYFDTFQAFKDAKSAIYYASKHQNAYARITNVFGDSVTQSMLARVYDELKSFEMR